jgi:UPF0271 protein
LRYFVILRVFSIMEGTTVGQTLNPEEAMRVDLNADLGEGVTDDAGLLQVVSSANVACGFHAGDVATMRSVCELAASRGVVVGAQVSYLDREGFGRRHMDVDTDVLEQWVEEQIGHLQDAAERAGTVVSYVKPHGALYNRVVDDREQAQAVLDGSGSLPVMGLPSSVILQQARVSGRVVCSEGFPDRGYTPAGLLIPRGQPGDLVEEVVQIARNAVHMASRDDIDSVCVHGDSAQAVGAAIAVREALEQAGYAVASWR